MHVLIGLGNVPHLCNLLRRLGDGLHARNVLMGVGNSHGLGNGVLL